MAYNVKFAKGSLAGYTGLVEKQSDTIYFITDTGALYLGTDKISDTADLEALKTLVGTIPSDITDVTTFAAWIQKVAQSVTNLDESLKSIAKSGKAADVSIEDTAGNLEATNVENAIAELVAKINGVGTAGAVTVVKETEVDGVAARYTFSQGGKAIANAVIDIPKDMVVKSGAVITLTETDDKGHTAGTYMKLVLANATDDEIWIPVDTLIEYVTSGSQPGDMVFITIDPITHKVTAAITDGSITKAKLDTDVKASLGKADTAIQSVTVLGHELTEGGSVTIEQAKEDLGLGTAAYQNINAFDTSGAAASTETNAKAYTDTALTWGSF